LLIDRVFTPPPSLLSNARRRRRVSAFGYAPIAALAKNKAFLVEAPGIEPWDAVRENPKRDANLAAKGAKRFENVRPGLFHLVPSDSASENIGTAT
jgi:hypothetical protein